jgi:PiT family inorganic phosphate transporter
VSIEVWLVMGMVLALAWANGANDIGKGVATLVGNGSTSARGAVLWATLWTVLGGLVAVIWGAALIKVFSSGYLSPGFKVDLAFVGASMSGAAGWVLVATRLGLPVSTTHALLGGVVGAVWMTAGFDGLQMDAVTRKALLPLLVSPLIAIVLCAFLLLVARCVATRVPAWKPGCCERESWRRNPFVCAIKIEKDAEETTEVSQGSSRSGRIWVALHWLSGGLTSFARGLNDVPKIAAFLVLVASIQPGVSATFGDNSHWPILLVTLFMAIGALWGGFRVLKLLSHRVVPLDASRGLVANMGTSLLVVLASPLGLPVSTTHVSTGSLMGVRWADRIRPQHGDALKTVLFAWLVTLPVAAGMAALTAFMF